MNLNLKPILSEKKQKDAYTSSWSIKERIGFLAWRIVWLFLFRPTFKPMNSWRIFLLKIFNAKIKGRPYISESAIIKIPWHLHLEDRACLSPNCEIYNLGNIYIKERATIAQYSYLCGGTHNFSKSNLPLVTGEINIGRDAFIGAKSFILPGISIGEGAIIGAGSVVTKDVEPWTVVGGNPAKFIKKREIHD